MRISIEAGGTTTQLSTRPAFYFDDARLDVADNSVAIAPVLASTVGDSAYITSINGVQPNNKGEFFIDGSECVSWGEVKGGTVMGGRPDETAEHDGMWLVDLCPSCTTCENVYRLKSEVENMKMWINTLKDVNLYSDDNTIWRRNALDTYRITGGTNAIEACGGDLNPDDKYLYLKGFELFQQYMTVVHMWNYVVEQRNAGTVISTAPEDVAAFVVQTKRPITKCGDDNKLSCKIVVSDGVLVYDDPAIDRTTDSVNGDFVRTMYPLQMLVLGPELSYEPFGTLANGEDAFGSLALAGSTTYSWIRQSEEPYWQPVEDSLYDPYHPCIRTAVADDISAKMAGTYTVSVRFMPFIHVLCSDYNDDLIGIRGTDVMVNGGTVATTKIEPETQSDEEFWPFGIKGSTVTGTTTSGGAIRILEEPPTQQDYLDSMRAPSCSVAWKILWTVNVLWAVEHKDTPEQEPHIETFQEDFQYLCNAPRAYFGGSVMMDSVFPVVGSTTAGGTDA